MVGVNARLYFLFFLGLIMNACDQGRDESSESDRKSTAPRLEKEAVKGDDKPKDQSPSEPDSLPEGLTSEEKMEYFKSNGISGVRDDVSGIILSNAVKIASSDDQLQYIAEQAAAWRKIDQFQHQRKDISEQHRNHLLGYLESKHDDSWKEMAVELERQVAAFEKLQDYRMEGIPNRTSDESYIILLEAFENYAPNYEKALFFAENYGKKE